jgi:hypothetical protein
METRGSLSIDPGSIQPEAYSSEIEVVVPYTDFVTTRAVLDRAVVMTAGLSARISLVAIHAVPYPAAFGCPSSVHSFLVEQLVDLTSLCALPVDAQVVLARTREDGFRHALKPQSTVLVGSPRRLWRTSEERMAKALVEDGHKVVLIHVG